MRLEGEVGRRSGEGGGSRKAEGGEGSGGQSYIPWTTKLIHQHLLSSYCVPGTYKIIPNTACIRSLGLPYKGL